ncbi:MAG TPA: lytic transglycosylase domain-containing protein [Blastocatellia bacterium]|nr:lytic transglycosylase domain-containing protein [Blastocatellia bacterium]
MMLKKLSAIVFLALAAVSAAAQQRPLSPPERTPVPLTNEDQDRARAEELKKKKAADTAALQKATPIKVPAVLAGHHISSGNAAIDALVQEASVQNGLDPCLVLSVIRAESSFNRTAVSVKGASGLMQLMPETATRFGVKNIFDPRENVLGGTKYLRWLLDRFRGDVRLALAGYNAGEGAVEFYGYRIPPFRETQNYVRLIYSRYSNIHLGSVPSAPAVEAIKPAEQPGEKNPTYNQIIRFTSSSGETARSGK